MFSAIFIPSLFTLFAFALQYLRSTHRDSAQIIPLRYLESIFVHPRDDQRQSSTKVLKVVDQPVKIGRLIQLILKIVHFCQKNGSPMVTQNWSSLSVCIRQLTNSLWFFFHVLPYVPPNDIRLLIFYLYDTGAHTKV